MRLSKMTKTFGELYRLPIADDVKQNYNKCTYLPWANAYQMAVELDPEFTFVVLPEEIVQYGEEVVETYVVKEFTDKYKKESIEKQVTRTYTPTYVMCNTEVTFFGVTKKMFLPVMDGKFNAVVNPSTRDIGDARMRCLVKNLALYGLGLHLYKGEDVPKDESIVEKYDVVSTVIETLEKQTDIDALKDYYANLEDSIKNNSNVKSVVKKMSAQIKNNIKG